MWRRKRSEDCVWCRSTTNSSIYHSAWRCHSATVVYSHSNTDSLRQDANYLDITIHKYNRTSDLIKENTAGELNLYTWFYILIMITVVTNAIMSGDHNSWYHFLQTCQHGNFWTPLIHIYSSVPIFWNFLQPSGGSPRPPLIRPTRLPLQRPPATLAPRVPDPLEDWETFKSNCSKVYGDQGGCDVTE